MLTDEQLSLLEEYASNFMTWKQIVVLLQVDEEEFRDVISDRNSAERKRYDLGKTKSAYEISKSLVRLAKLGSPQAELLVKTDITRQEDAEDDL
jgi:hypothetical protein